MKVSISITVSVVVIFLISSLNGFALEYSNACYAAQQENYELAQKKLEQLIINDPDNYELLYDAGVICAKNNEYARAKGYFNAASRHSLICPELQQKALFNAGNMHVELDELEAAVNIYNQLLALNPDHEKAMYNKKIVENLLAQRKKEQEKQKEDQDKKKDDLKDNQKKSDENKKNNDEQNKKNDQQEKKSDNGSEDEKSTKDRNPSNKENKPTTKDEDGKNISSHDGKNSKQNLNDKNNQSPKNESTQNNEQKNPLEGRDRNPWQSKKQANQTSQSTLQEREKKSPSKSENDKRRYGNQGSQKQEKKEGVGNKKKGSDLMASMDKQVQAYLSKLDDYDAQGQKAIIQRALSTNDDSTNKVGW